MAPGSRYDTNEKASPQLFDDRDEHSCPRCQGFLVDDWLLDMAQGGYLWGAGRRCVNCGHIMPVAVRASRAQRESTPASPSSQDAESWHEAA